MKEFKGTPGPWNLTNGKKFTKKVNGSNWYEFASVIIRLNGDDSNSEIGEANAKLIAATPELLELAFKYKADLLNMLHQSTARDNRIAQIDEIINKALS